MLQTLERDNLFLVALDDRREWYRYHQLFADVLRARLLAEQPELVPVLHRRASEWFEQHDLLDEASARPGGAGRRPGRPAGGAGRAGDPAAPAGGQDAGWLAALPDDTVRRSPVLSVFAAAVAWWPATSTPSTPRLDDAERALATAPTAAPRGPTPRSCARCRRRSPSTGRPWPRPRRRRGTRGTRPARPRPRRTRRPPRPRRGGRVPGLAAWAGRRAAGVGDVRPGRGEPARGRATSSTSWAAPSCSPTCGGRPGGPVRARELCDRALRGPRATASRRPGDGRAARGAGRARHRGRRPRGRAPAPRRPPAARRPRRR